MNRNLTGNKRIVHDCCIDLYNNIQKWKTVASNLHSIISEICLIKQKELSDSDKQEIVGEDNSEKTMWQLQSLSEELLCKFEGLEAVMCKISRLPKKLKAINALSELEQSRNDSSDVDLDPVLFKTWPLSRFCNSVEELEKMYMKEFKVKSSITKEISTVTKKSNLIILEATWKYEPNIDTDKVDEILGGIIAELELFSHLS
ncbi:hypothetical protein JTE90_019675 [Oedothorax gibbosus]|uniref:Cyclin-dependent kinase 2-interacting protein n=1 Tax=Oedothorax gibbosus TaxID=931172 RepID=A0AAV6UZQ6_9ARAC|nr:hypothetical protein JTE90_019675 [Oedothorax gibbosus]